MQDMCSLLASKTSNLLSTITIYNASYLGCHHHHKLVRPPPSLRRQSALCTRFQGVLASEYRHANFQDHGRKSSYNLRLIHSPKHIANTQPLKMTYLQARLPAFDGTPLPIVPAPSSLTEFGNEQRAIGPSVGSSQGEVVCDGN